VDSPGRLFDIIFSLSSRDLDEQELELKVDSYIFRHVLCGMSFTRMRDSLRLAESVEKDRLLEECALDPTVFDKVSIITRSYQNKKRVSDLFYFSVVCI